jgi:hypothetical protein
VAVAVLIVLLFWGGVFMVALAARGLTPLEFLFGRYEPLPGDLGRWKECGIDDERGYAREERLLLPPGGANSGYLLLQVRYRDQSTREVVSVEPERYLRRRRVSARS